MKKDLARGFVFLIIALFVGLGGIYLFNNVQSKTYAIGEVTAKYRNGDNNSLYHIVIKDETKDNELIDLTLNAGDFNRFNIKDRVRADYSLLREVESISSSTLSADAEPPKDK